MAHLSGAARMIFLRVSTSTGLQEPGFPGSAFPAPGEESMTEI